MTPSAAVYTRLSQKEVNKVLDSGVKVKMLPHFVYDFVY